MAWQSLTRTKPAPDSKKTGSLLHRTEPDQRHHCPLRRIARIEIHLGGDGPVVEIFVVDEDLLDLPSAPVAEFFEAEVFCIPRLGIEADAAVGLEVVTHRLEQRNFGDKRFMYDESYRTPLLASWPGKIAPGSVNGDLVSNLDFAQTFLEIAGADRPDDMQGASLVPLLKGETPDDWRSTHYYHYYEYPGWHMVQRHEGVYDGRYKLMNFYDINEWELYDLETDPQEMKNQIEKPDYAEVAERLRTELDRLREQYEVPENQIQSMENLNMRFHSDEIFKRQMELKRKRDVRAAKKAQR